MRALTAAQNDASSAAIAAAAAAGAAGTALTDIEGKGTHNQEAYDKAMAAKAAAEAAAAEAQQSNLRAIGSATSDVAKVHAAAAQAARDRATDAQGDAEMYAGQVMTSYDTAMAEDKRVEDVTMYTAAADTAAKAARKAAEDAKAAAARVTELSPGSDAETRAKAAAMMADTAAVDAEAALAGIDASGSAADAKTAADKAEAERGKAEAQYKLAKAEREIAVAIAEGSGELLRIRDVENAQEAADVAKDAAKEASDAANTAANAAETARDNAKAALDRARAARTDATGAKAAAMMARTAANNANAAYMAAKMAAEGINADGTAEDAEIAQDTAETKQGEAETAQGTAETQQGLAKTAETDAETAAGKHVLSLFLAANGAHVPDLESTMNVNETADHVKSVGAAMAAIANVGDGAQAAGTTATASYPGDTVDNPTTTGDDANEFMEGMFSITVNVAGTTNIVSELRESRAATDLNGDGDTDDTDEAAYTQTARKIADLGAFAGYDLWEDDGDATTTTDRARAIVFTNKQKGDDSVLAVTAATARSARGVAITAASELAKVTSTGTTITGVEWTPSGDTVPLTGTLSCPANAACDITLGAEGAVTAISGYTFTGSRAAREAVDAAAAAEDNDYLAFGIWLDQDGTTNTFGAFASGGTGYAVNVQNAVTGTASYNGNAAGAHHKTGEGVNFFQGNASLTANFGVDDVPGSISGSISSIRVNGGPPMSTPIYLGQAALADGTATFNGAAFMGEATAPGASTHEFDGTWSGSFFGATEDDEDTTTVNESVTAPLAAAGTFGVTKSTGTGDDMVVESFVGAFGAHK